MTSLALIPWASTDWGAAGRLASRTPLPLNECGRTQAGAWGAALAGHEVGTLYSSREQASVETAALVIERAEAKHKHVEGLDEVDFGLWEGLVEEQLQDRFPKLFKKWIDDPVSVCVPDGEDLGHATERVRTAVKQVAKKHRRGVVGLVLGPTVLALCRCELEGAPISRFREFLSDGPVWYELDASGETAKAAAPA